MPPCSAEKSPFRRFFSHLFNHNQKGAAKPRPFAALHGEDGYRKGVGSRALRAAVAMRSVTECTASTLPDNSIADFLQIANGQKTASARFSGRGGRSAEIQTDDRKASSAPKAASPSSICCKSERSFSVRTIFSNRSGRRSLVRRRDCSLRHRAMFS